MKKETMLAFALASLAACGGDSSSSIDAPVGPGHDAPGTGVDAAPLPTMITISGVASTISISGKVPTAGVMIVAKKASDDSTISMTTSAADGTFSISAPTSGSPVDAYLIATKSGDLDTYLYPPGPLSKDFANIPVFVLTASTRDLANQIGGANPQAATESWVGAVIQDANSTAVAGAVFTATPAGGMIHYNSSSGQPQAQATSTAVDGTAYYMNAPAGNVTVGATMTGMTFHSHTINARAGKITLTLVTP